MNNNKKIHIKNLILLIVILVLLAGGISLTMSRYISQSSSNLNADVAFYVVKESFQTGNIFIENIYPSSSKYSYQVSVTNTDGTHTAETSIEYTFDLEITTNLPLSFSVYKNGSSTPLTSSSDISNQIVLDASGQTYLRKIQIKGDFTYGVTKTDTYRIEVTFPETYAEYEEFEGMVDNINIKLDAKQKIS